MTKPSISFILFVFGYALLAPQTAWALPLIDPGNFQIDQSKLMPKLPLLPGAKAKNTEAFCANFTATTEQIQKTITDKGSALDSFRAAWAERLDERRDARDEKLNNARFKADERRMEWYTRLEAKADTDAKKDALLAFKQAVEKAIDTRRETIDAAIKTFRSGVDSLVTKRQSELSLAQTTFAQAVTAAVNQVKADCNAGEPTATIRQKFRTALKTARENLKADKQAATDAEKDVKTLTEARRTAIQKAITDFTTALGTARTELRSAFDATTSE